MVTAFTPDNISAFGSLAVVAIVYQVLGVALAWCVREMLYVPTDFRWGILVVSAAANLYPLFAHDSSAYRRIGVHFILVEYQQMLIFR